MGEWLERLRGGTLSRFLDHIWGLGASLPPPGADAPVISLICKAPQRALLDSLADQASEHLQLVPENRRTGGWTATLRGDERLAPHSAAVLSAALGAHPHASRAYTDTLYLDAQGDPLRLDLKPAYDPILQAARPYAHALALHRIGAEPGGPVLHIPYPALILPNCSASDAPTPPNPALRSHGLPNPYTANPARPVPAARGLPRVSVVIPSRDAPGLIRRVLAGLFETTDYPDLEVIVSDNGSSDPETLAEYARRHAQGLRVIRHEAPFNFAAQVNRGVAAARGDALLLLNNDIVIREPGWLQAMVACLALETVGIVGARLLFPDGSLQHAGVILGLGGGYAGHWYAGRPAETAGPLERLHHTGRVSAVTAACMLVSRHAWDALGGMDAETFGVAYNDVDFCLRATAYGIATVWTPQATLVHHESATRRLVSAADRARFRAEKAALRARHATDRVLDPALSPWLSRARVPRWQRLATLPAPQLGWQG
ncbi:MAG: glycosyltransferase family 2 protein [Pseudomonadota bacterium]